MAYSPAGRLIRRRIPDSRQAENVFILFAVAVLLVLMLANQFAWAFIRTEVLASPEGPLAIAFWVTQLVAGFGYLFGFVVGFKPEIVVTWTPETLRIDTESDSVSVDHEDVLGVQVVSPLSYHRHYRRYAATRDFVNRLPEEVLLVQTDDGPIMLGLDADDRSTLMKLMRPVLEPVVLGRREPLLAVA